MTKVKASIDLSGSKFCDLMSRSHGTIQQYPFPGQGHKHVKASKSMLDIKFSCQVHMVQAIGFICSYLSHMIRPARSIPCHTFYLYHCQACFKGSWIYNLQPRSRSFLTNRKCFNHMTRSHHAIHISIVETFFPTTFKTCYTGMYLD